MAWQYSYECEVCDARVYSNEELCPGGLEILCAQCDAGFEDEDKSKEVETEEISPESLRLVLEGFGRVAKQMKDESEEAER